MWQMLPGVKRGQRNRQTSW